MSPLFSRLSITAVISLSACASASLSTTQKPAAPRQLTASQGHRPTAVRTFADLIVAPAIAAQPNIECVLTESASGLRLGIPLSPATKTLPELPGDLAARLDAAPNPARVLSRWGRLGADTRGPVLVSLTRVPMRATQGPAVAVFATARGAYVRAVQGDFASIPTTPFPLDALGPTLSRLRRATLTVFLTAEADLPVATLADVLRSVPAESAVALCVTLPANTVLPEQAPPAEPSAGYCETLPDPDEGETEADLPVATLQAGLAPMQELARNCMHSSEASSPGRVVLALRIADGHVRDACLVEDDLQVAVLTTCLVESAKSMHFEQVAEGTFIDVHLPLRLDPIDDPAPTPICVVP